MTGEKKNNESGKQESVIRDDVNHRWQKMLGALRNEKVISVGKGRMTGEKHTWKNLARRERGTRGSDGWYRREMSLVHHCQQVVILIDVHCDL